MILFGERWILFGFVWSLLQGCLKGNSEDLFSHMNSNKKKEEKKKKQTKKQMNDWLRNKVVFIWDLFFYFLFFWAQSEAGGGEGHADQKIESCLSTTWYDTVDNAVPCGKSLFPWKSSVWKAVGQRNKEDGDRKSSFWDTKWCWPSCWFFFFSLFLDRDRRSHPTKIPLHKLSLWAPFVKKAGGWRKSA